MSTSHLFFYELNYFYQILADIFFLIYLNLH